MNEQWYWQLAQERQRELLAEAKRERLLREAGIRDSVPAGLKLLGLALVILPLVVLLARGLTRA